MKEYALVFMVILVWITGIAGSQGILVPSSDQLPTRTPFPPRTPFADTTHSAASFVEAESQPRSLANADGAKALGRVTHESVARAGVAFNPAQSRGVFVGINQYTAPRGVKPPNLKSCVNDAVDLAAAFMDLGLINGPGITLALSGEPTKPTSTAALNRLLLAGAVRLADARRDTVSDAVYAAAETAGAEGILFLTWSAHGFEANGVQYLTPENFSSATERPSTAEIQGNSIAESTLAAIAQSSPAQRRVLLFDACRETKALGVGIPQLIAGAVGTVTLYAVTSGELALDGSRNGAFTEKVLGALTGPPPPALKADRNGHITVGTLLEYLGTAGKIEDPKILQMPLREDPRVAGQAEARETAFNYFREAKQVDIAAPRDEQMLDVIGLRVFEDALFTPAGPTLAREVIALLDTAEKRADFRNRRSFAAAWRDAGVTTAPPPPTLAQPTPRPAPAGLGIDELLALQDSAKTEWEKLQKLDALENVKPADKARFYDMYIANFEQANFKLAEARQRQRYWADWKPPTPSPSPSLRPSPSPSPSPEPTPIPRFTKASTGVITDSKTNLQWILGPDNNITYKDGAAWVQSCRVDGGGWRMPTREELKTLFEKGLGTKNIDPIFEHSGIVIWAEKKSSRTAWGFSFVYGNETSGSSSNDSHMTRVWGVRTAPRR